MKRKRNNYINSELLTTKEAASFLRVSPSTLYRMEKLELLIPYRTPGGQRRYDVRSLKEYLRKSKNFRPNFNNAEKKKRGS